MAGHVMHLTTLKRSLHARPPVQFQVPGANALGGAVSDHVNLLKKCAQLTSHRNSGGLHIIGTVTRCRVNRDVQGRSRLNTVVGADVTHSHQLHVRLQSHRVSNALADHSISVDRYPYLSVACHISTSFPGLRPHTRREQLFLAFVTNDDSTEPALGWTRGPLY